MSSSIRRVLVSLGVVCLSGCVSTAPSPPASKPAELDPDIVFIPRSAGVPGKAVAFGVLPMSYEALSTCGNLIRTLTELTAILSQDAKDLDARKDALNAEEKAINDARPLVDTKKAGDVKAFNDRLTRFRDQVRTVNGYVTGYNGNVARLKVETNQFNTSCAGRAYRRSDLAKLAPDLRDAIMNKSTATDIPIRNE